MGGQVAIFVLRSIFGWEHVALCVIIGGILRRDVFELLIIDRPIKGLELFSVPIFEGCPWMMVAFVDYLELMIEISLLTIEGPLGSLLDLGPNWIGTGHRRDVITLFESGMANKLLRQSMLPRVRPINNSMLIYSLLQLMQIGLIDRPSKRVLYIWHLYALNKFKGVWVW